MKSFSSSPTLRVGVLTAVLGLARVGHAQTITTIDAPHSLGTRPQAVNAFGRIAGYYFDDANFALHGFVRTAWGTITPFDAPSLGEPSAGFGTQALAINATGQIAGTINGVSMNALVSRGFVRDTSGAITEFDAAAGAILTTPQAISPEGWVAGTYVDASFIAHGFVRSAHGAITRYDVPGFILVIRKIDANAELIGSYQDNSGVLHGFVRAPDGTLTSFEAPGASPDTGGIFCNHCAGTFATAASGTDRVVGYYGGADHVKHGFLREANGAISILDVPGAVATHPAAINLQGDIAGEYFDATPSSGHAFVQSRNGVLESFDIAGSSNLVVTGIGLDSEVIGYYGDASGTPHGFIRTPRADCARFGR